ncbi:uncharacterized protein LOC126887115 [Diabrotica virgifera virgifera]|uniref:DUF7869 domain-containing protein n=1 Tax=Diabrotica virgifera virgifera TaxID=50390 RepID=A0ABM5KJN7_DIAVI|nr:uncharacterized protein LOC126887115 [Diabrotica virgifera virgifera]
MDGVRKNNPTVDLPQPSTEIISMTTSINNCLEANCAKTNNIEIQLLDLQQVPGETDSSKTEVPCFTASIDCMPDEDNELHFTDFEDSGSEFDPKEAIADESDSTDQEQEDEQEDKQEDEQEDEQEDKQEDEQEDEPQHHTRQTSRPKKGRVAKYPGQTFKSRKKLKDGNKKHYTVKGILKEPKQYIDFQCKCTLKCNEHVLSSIREKWFQQFWGLESYNAQTAFIAATIKVQGIKRKRNIESNRRQNTRIYEINNVRVCRDMYIQTLRISPKRVNTALNKIKAGNVKDERGFKIGGHKKISQEIKNKVISQIAKFPTYISHYCRNETDARFLATDLTLNKMYNLYNEEETNDKIGFSIYKTIFYENFNLRRKPPVKDTCNICDSFNIKIKNKDLLEEQYKSEHENHLLNSKDARETMKRDLEQAKSNRKLEVVTYDMEKVLGLPKLPTNLVYYKRQLSLYHEGVHVGSTNTPYCFIWTESMAGRGAQEVGSCLKKFVDNYLAEGKEQLILWSDSCGGQNRNIKIVLMLKAVLETHRSLKTIYFKYLIPGHSFLPNDTDFGEVERSLKYQIRLYTLNEFKQVLENCSKKKKFVACEMTKDDFFGTSQIEKSITNRKTNINNEKISWLKARVIMLDKDHPQSIFMKYSHKESEEFKEINIKKITKGRPSDNNNSFFASKLFKLYPDGKELSQKKIADLKTLMSFVPNDVKHFYRDLRGANFEDDVEGFGETIDFDVETLNEC